jgi:hypothetical protein
VSEKIGQLKSAPIGRELDLLIEGDKIRYELKKIAKETLNLALTWGQIVPR